MNSTLLANQKYSTSTTPALVCHTVELEVQAPNFQDLLRVQFEKAGWTIRRHLNDPDFRIHELQGRQVAFSMLDEHGKVSEFAGVLKHSGRVASAFFQLEGREDFFNANLAGIMAVEPV